MVMDDKLKEIVELSVLFDFYGELLKDHNKQVFEDYILNDLSLGEIAEEKGISRQGVFDIIKRCSKQLKDYEVKLNLVKKFELTKSKVNQIKDTAKQLKAFSKVESQSGTSEMSLGLEEIIQLTDSVLQDL
ncbi:MAG: YlxM family DNA-binding protein [Bacteroidales bacterium]|nr:YlxM family DNA-binding protein [Bacteroidales bacterium]